MKKICLAWAMLLVGMNCYSHSGPEVPEPIGLDELAAAFGWNFDETEITAQKITDDFHVLFGAGGNIGVSVGADGVFIVDDQFPQLMPKIKKAIGDLGGDSVDFAVTTHWHFDHADGNPVLAASQRVRRRLAFRDRFCILSFRVCTRLRFSVA